MGFLGQGVLEADVLFFPKLHFFTVWMLPGSFSEDLDFELICVSDWTLSCVGWEEVPGWFSTEFWVEDCAVEDSDWLFPFSGQRSEKSKRKRKC